MEEKEMTGAAPAVEVLSSPEVLALLQQVQHSAPALTRILQRLDEFQASGALDTVIDLADVLQAARVSMTDSMISRIGDGARAGMELLDTLMLSGIAERAPGLLNAAMQAHADATADQRRVGLLDLVKALREPQMQFALKFMLALTRRLPEATRG